MCCFAKPVRVVSDTNIYSRLTGRGTQMLAYQMKYDSDELNAMILPIPIAKQAAEDSLRFISLKGYSEFFDHLELGFPALTLAGPGFGRGGVSDSKIKPDLVVHQVGDFVASFVPTMNDFVRLDQQFVIPKSSWDKIPAYADYGFAVFQLKSLRGKPHPMAFEFETRFKDQIFFPTVHIHDGEVHAREKYDHALYLQNDRFDPIVKKYLNSHVKDKKTGFVRSKKTAGEFMKVEKSAGLIDPKLLVHRTRLKGTLQNKDVFTAVTPARNRKLFGGFVLPSSLAGLIGCAGLGWTINRRNLIRKNSEAKSKNDLL